MTRNLEPYWKDRGGPMRGRKGVNEANNQLREDIAEMIADWYGRSVIDADRELAEQIIARVRNP